MTLPACTFCNIGFSEDETRAAAVICTVSFTDTDRVAVAPGGWVHSAMQKDESLRQFVSSRLGTDGIFRPDQEVIWTIKRIAVKTALGLLFHEYGRLIPIDDHEVIAIQHAKNVPPSALVERHRRDDALWAEVTPSGRELERQVLADYGYEPPHMPEWHMYVPEFFEYMCIRRSNGKLLTALKLHDALTVLLECPWPTKAGPRRGGKPPKRRCA